MQYRQIIRGGMLLLLFGIGSAGAFPIQPRATSKTGFPAPTGVALTAAQYDEALFGLASGGLARGTTQTLTASGQIDCRSNAIIPVAGSGGAVTLTSNPQFLTPTDLPATKLCFLEGTSNTNTLTIVEGNGVDLAGGSSITLGLRDVALLVYNGAMWILIGTGGGGSGVTDGDKGDITVSGSGVTWTIDANAVALTTDTTGNYVAGVTTNQGLLLTGTEGATVGLIACTAGQILKNSGGTSWACAADDAGAGGVVVLNETTTGTTINKLAKWTGAPARAVLLGINDTSGAIGVVIAGAGTSGSATIITNGMAECLYDAATTAGNYVVFSDTIAGACKDAGATFPVVGEVIGRVLETIASSGLADTMVGLTGDEVRSDPTKLPLTGGTVSGQVQLQGATSSGTAHAIGSNDTFLIVYDNANTLTMEGWCGGTRCVNSDKIAVAGGRFRWGGSFANNIVNIDGNSGATTFAGAVGITGAATMSSSLTVAGVVSGMLDVRLHTAAAVVLTAADCKGQWHIDNDNDAIDFTLPAAAVGLNCCFQQDFNQVMTIDTADTSDTIRLDGTALTAGNAIDSPATAGAFICLLAKDSSTWNTAGRSGTWVNGGAD